MIVRFGFCAPIFAGAGDAHPRSPLLARVDVDHLRHSVVEAESLGYDSLWVADHLMLGRESLILEGWTFLSWASLATSRMRLGTIHLSNLLRPPALTAKMAATLDTLSGGRVDFFFEAGHRGTKPEAESYGYEFADDETRLAAFAEALQIIKALWSGNRISFEGEHYMIRDAICQPKPVQAPHPPVWIGTLGGDAESKGLAPHLGVIDLVARYADGWNNTPASVGHCRVILDALKDACRRHGREYGTIRKSLETQVLVAETPAQVRQLQDAILAANPAGRHYTGDNWDALGGQYLIGDVDTVVSRIRDYADLGIDTIQLWFMDYPSLDGMRTFARRVMPHFAA